MSAPSEPTPPSSIVPETQITMDQSDGDFDDPPRTTAGVKRGRESNASAASDEIDVPPPAKTRKASGNPPTMDMDANAESEGGAGPNEAGPERAQGSGKGKARKGKGKALATEVTEANYAVDWDGSKLKDEDVRAKIKTLVELGMLDNHTLTFSRKSIEAQQKVFAGYVKINILDETAVEWKANEINDRVVDKDQAKLLVGHLIDAGCDPDHNWLIASIEDASAFEAVNGGEWTFSKTPGNAPLVKTTGNVWRIAGNHRFWGIRWYYKTCVDGAGLAAGLDEAMQAAGDDPGDAMLNNTKAIAADVKLEYQKRVKVIESEWKEWPVAIYWRPELMADTPEMAKLRTRLAGNKAPHQYAGGPRENFQMVVKDPSSARRLLSQEPAKVWYARALRPMIRLWVPFTGLDDHPTFRVNSNAARAEAPYLGVWTTLVCAALEKLHSLVKPGQDEIASEGSGDITNATFYGFITIPLLNIFDKQYNSTLGRVLQSDLPVTPAGFVIPAWRKAYLEYCQRLINSTASVIDNQDSLPLGLPSTWYDLRKNFAKMFVARIKQAAATVRLKPEDQTTLWDTFPWFSEAVADDMLTLARQVGPGIAVMAEILDPAWRIFRARAAKPGVVDENALNADRNRKDSDYPDEASIVLHQGFLRLRERELPEDQWGRLLFDFIAQLALSPLGTALSAKAVDLGLRRADGIEDPIIGIPKDNLTPLARPLREPPKALPPGFLGKKARHVVAYFRNKIVKLAMVPSRRTYQKGDELIQHVPVDEAMTHLYISEAFDDFMENVFERSFFPAVAPSIKMEWDTHVHGFHALYKMMSGDRRAALQPFVTSVEFSHFWKLWLRFQGDDPALEEPLYHAYLEVPDGEVPPWIAPRPHSFVLALPYQLPTHFKDEALEDEQATARQLKRSMIKEPRTKRGGKSKTVNDDVGSSKRTAESSTRKSDSQKMASASGGAAVPDSTPAEAGPSDSTAAILPSQGGDVFWNDRIGHWDEEIRKPDEAARTIGVIMTNIIFNVEHLGMDVLRVHSLFNIGIAHFVLKDLSSAVVEACVPIRWSIIAATLILGRVDKALYIPPPTPHYQSQWTKAIETLEASSSVDDPVPSQDLLGRLSIPPERTVGLLSLTPEALYDLRNRLRRILDGFPTGSLPKMADVAETLLHDVEKSSIAGRAKSTRPRTKPATTTNPLPLATTGIPFDDAVRYPPSPLTTEQPHPPSPGEPTDTSNATPAILTQAPAKLPLEPQATDRRQTRSTGVPTVSGQPSTSAKAARGSRKNAETPVQGPAEASSSTAGPLPDDVAGSATAKKRKKLEAVLKK